ncbi:MAG: hypothetical protein H7305_02945 [Gemmatimonadaceae bacterium]|nr:hypothetical protein [Gemmatimonadaceae bacterium]
MHGRPAGSRTTSLPKALVVGEGLRPVHTGHNCASPPQQSVRHRRAFIEVKEQFGGFVLIEHRHLNEAIQMAARMSSARTGSVEVRAPSTEIS